MQRHYVTFLSPGTFVSESTTREIDCWDTKTAFEMSKSVFERYEATPYAFYFFTKERKEDDFEPKIIKESNRYFIGGKHGRFLTLEEIKAKNDLDDSILIGNMITNKYERVYETTEGWKFTVPVKPDDVLLDF